LTPLPFKGFRYMALVMTIMIMMNTIMTSIVADLERGGTGVYAPAPTANLYSRLVPTIV